MKTILIILASLSIMSAGCTSLSIRNRDDGYALYIQACEEHETSYSNSDDAAWKEITVFLQDGGTLSKSTLQIIEAQQNVFSLIAKANRAQSWALPDNTGFSAATTFPHIMSWLRINRAATAKAILLYRDGKSQETFNFLIPFNTAGQNVSKAGTLIHILVYIASRGMQYPVLASSIDELPDAYLSAFLSRVKEHYEQIPTICDCLEAEKHMAINTTKRLFSDLQEQLTPNRKKMIEDLQKAGVEEKTLKQIKNEQLFSVADWERQVLSDFRSLQSFYTNALVTYSPTQLREVDDEIEARIKKIGSNLEYEAALAAWNLFMTNQVSGSFSMSDAKRLHSQVGKAISHQLLGMMMPAIGSFGIRYREFIASERLLLIRLAVRTFVHKHGKIPLTLQQLVDDKLLNEGMIIDPLSGQEFLTKAGGTFEAYSVGRDLDDDKGVPWNRKTESGDTILTPLREMWSVQQKPSP